MLGEEGRPSEGSPTVRCLALEIRLRRLRRLRGCRIVVRPDMSVEAACLGIGSTTTIKIALVRLVFRVSPPMLSETTRIIKRRFASIKITLEGFRAGVLPSMHC